MTVFKTFLHILNKNKVTVIIYTMMLLIFGATNMQNSENNMTFTLDKPDIMIINEDKNGFLTKDLVKYLNKNANVIKVKENIDDSLFYREVNYIVYIPENFSDDMKKHLNPKIDIKSTGDYQASLAEMILSKYLKVAKVYINSYNDNDEIIKNINKTINLNSNTKIISKLDSTNLERVSFYYNFASYSLLAILIFIIGTILSTFNDIKIKKRIIISSMNYKKNNKILLFSNLLYSACVWLIYVIVSIILFGNIMFTIHGSMFIVNSLIFTICVTSLAMLVGNLVNDKEALSGIVNVISLGSSFLCGAFVPQIWLPSSVLIMAHILPTYYYIKTNDLLTTLEKFDFESLNPIYINTFIIIGFTILFVIITNIILNKKRKVG